MAISKRNYILVDFENTQKVETGRLNDLPVRIVIFVSDIQKTLPINLARKLLDFQGSAEIYESAGSGKNALDFQIAFYAGRIFEREPEAVIHIVSKDKGFDPMVKHLKSLGRVSSRVDNFADLPFLKVVEPKTIVEKEDHSASSLDRRIEFIIGRLNKIQANARPRKMKTLLSSVDSHFQKQLNLAAVKEVVSELVRRNHVMVGESESVTYSLKAKKA